MIMQIKGYIVTSADGYSATNDGSTDFLTQFQNIDCWYDDFISDIDIVIMGCKTYETIVSFDGEWPYPNQMGFIVSSKSDLELVHPSLSIWNEGPIALVEHLEKKFDGNVWVVGGTQLQNVLIDHNLLNSLEIYIMPIVLGDGIPLFPSHTSHSYQLKSMSAEMIHNQIIKQVYIFFWWSFIDWRHKFYL